MNILHYSLGSPPYRSGGLTKFCMDLASQQLKEGHSVGILWPGQMTASGEKCRIKKGDPYQGIQSYELIDPNPVSYDEGIADIPAFLHKGDENVYTRFLQDLKPDIIHVHTLMGIHENFITAAKRLGIRTCFTTHDFYPICPKVTLFRNGDICPDAADCGSCPACNGTALSMKKIRLLQTPAYRKMKDSPIVKKLRKDHRDAYLSDEHSVAAEQTNNQPDDYRKLRDHYGQILSKIDVVHYNSSVAKDVYERFFSLSDHRVIPITHSDVLDHREKKEFSEQLRISYLGPQSAHKGYYILKQALDHLWEERQDFILNVYFEPVHPSEYEVRHDRYSYEELETVMRDSDVVVVPSIWYETFGFTAEEAMSYGIPVVVSSRVGAKDIIPEDGGIIFEEITPDGICEVFRNLDRSGLQSMNECLCHTPVLTMEQMSREIREYCYI